jgi:hypothetical protein
LLVKGAELVIVPKHSFHTAWGVAHSAADHWRDTYPPVSPPVTFHEAVWYRLRKDLAKSSFPWLGRAVRKGSCPIPPDLQKVG